MKMLFVFLVMVCGCAGYRWGNQDNPFKRYGIRSVSIPTFVNRSGFPHVAAPITKEVFLMLSEYPSLMVYSGEKEGVDGVLLGIVYSEDRRKDIIKTSERIYLESELSKSIGDRPRFLLPSASHYQLRIQLALVKNPSLENSEIVFNKTFSLQGNFKREVRGIEGLTNFTKTKKRFEQSVESLAKRAADRFKETVLNAF